MRYDFGCGYTKREGYVGVDFNPATGADIIWDLTVPCPQIPDDSADHVLCSHVIEHIPSPHHELVILQIIRVLKPGGAGTFEIRVPHPGHDMAMVPDHRHWFTRRYIDEVIVPMPRIVVDKVESTKTPYYYDLIKKFDMPASMVEDVFRNVAGEYVIQGHKV